MVDSIGGIGGGLPSGGAGASRKAQDETERKSGEAKSSGVIEDKIEISAKGASLSESDAKQAAVNAKSALLQDKSLSLAKNGQALNALV